MNTPMLMMLSSHALIICVCSCVYLQAARVIGDDDRTPSSNGLRLTTSPQLKSHDSSCVANQSRLETA